MDFKLPDLPYPLDALAPVIDKTTMEFHYGKHHQAYVNNLNNLVPGTPFENASLETIINEADGSIFNNAAQVWNHTFYFMSFKPGGGGEYGVPIICSSRKETEKKRREMGNELEGVSSFKGQKKLGEFYLKAALSPDLDINQ